jgi:hypothetical protein
MGGSPPQAGGRSPVALDAREVRRACRTRLPNHVFHGVAHTTDRDGSRRSLAIKQPHLVRKDNPRAVRNRHPLAGHAAARGLLPPQLAGLVQLPSPLDRAPPPPPPLPVASASPTETRLPWAGGSRAGFSSDRSLPLQFPCARHDARGKRRRRRRRRRRRPRRQRRRRRRRRWRHVSTVAEAGGQSATQVMRGRAAFTWTRCAPSHRGPRVRSRNTARQPCDTTQQTPDMCAGHG